ncbi:thiamine pyrophosphate-dependent dehydrogenase E1 component subunit alpha [Nitratireductor sp. B36]|jgi:pyruvate dehydrogenase E1 component alpha subunit|uniref:thiamine pyrophosphate-dependent dehydrogenase E1 component subunit alpha n=1 Tax=Nitratireductor sp. B36 TaxID=2762059 RepID=UPI001E2E4544|nr:thiamine pyrophosphate-dependent dehydrogenase E1 component subunit alpha [Nitratireductor sp. B36]
MTAPIDTAVAEKVPRSNTELLALYRQMRRVRTFEERVGELFVRGQSAGSMLHLSIGEESAAVGVASLMRDGDTFTTHHRGHGIFLARGADPNRMMAEIGGKEEGYCRGKGGSMHIADMGLGHLGANAIVGGGIPAVVGAGLASKREGRGAVSIAFFGDGAMQQGILYESMNMAALWDLPVIFVCINNQYGMGTRIEQATKGRALHERGLAFGLNSETVDGLDVRDVRAAAGRIIDGARGGTPGFLAVECYRFFGHARMDKSPYRTPEDEEQGRAKDPVGFARKALVESGESSEADLDALDAEIAQEMDATIDFTVAAREPALQTMFRDVYAPGEPEPESVAARIDRILAGD